MENISAQRRPFKNIPSLGEASGFILVHDDLQQQLEENERAVASGESVETRQEAGRFLP